jgi:hypothetical protein
LSCLRIFAFKCFTCGFRLMKMKNLQKRWAKNMNERVFDDDDDAKIL